MKRFKGYDVNKELNEICELRYNNACNLYVDEKGRAFKERNNYLFNYIYDDFGYRVGVIVSYMDKEKNLPKIGWALMTELTLGTPNIIIEKPYDIPTFKELVDRNYMNSKLFPYYMFIRNLMDYDISTLSMSGNIGNTIILSHKQRDMLIDIALARAITYSPEVSKNYYCPSVNEPTKNKGLLRFNIKEEDDDTYGPFVTDIKNNRLWLISGVTIKGETQTALCKRIRDAVRAMEFRAWRYYKYEG